ncbi:293R [Invertebrate iridescent virus Kaz2018]|uniref:Uncharacterized protein 293R n=1 Tax=Invertebrate iridescent virus 6 TaxID=176652 RepID=293R_IIV6|nr:293R [Invertebrate iridescent virus 6]Q91FN1.1 RecName: Full=Uncharacterized protein 293R [Invertebrate iridescent virus 6]AAK82154.1 293R [Invertebrate iridescent virus 6]QMS79742.1 hypothetical protein IIV6-T1_287 [Invertebrate iridescent virus 6]QNH08703.1 293R [Invertebrate iridescent virus Kaz2018]
MASVDTYKKNWKQFFNDHDLDDNIQQQLYNIINNMRLEDFRIIITNHNTVDDEIGPRPYSEFTIGDVKGELHCCGYFFIKNNTNYIIDYYKFQDQFYESTSFCINDIKELIFTSLFEESNEHMLEINDEENRIEIQDIFKKFFDVILIEKTY